jgi:hypothetical protein
MISLDNISLIKYLLHPFQLAWAFTFSFYVAQGLGLAKQLAEKVNSKLNYIPVEPEKEEETTSSEDRYEDEIEINSFPQQARWKITSKVCIKHTYLYS